MSKNRGINYFITIFLLGLTFLLNACGDSDNTTPIADAGSDQTSSVIVGDVVVLDGSASNDADGDVLSFSWSLVSAPGGSTATLSDSTVVNPSFTADMAGTYALQLVVNDGIVDSAPDEMLAVVVIPPPTVVIASPEPLTIATANPVTITGTVDDPNAIITVDGNATPNSNGSYSADVTLSEGNNTVTVNASNSTGDGSASVDVVLQTLPGPTISITSHRQNFTAGFNWDGTGIVPTNNIPVRVSGAITTDNGPPTVTVNGSNATISSLANNPLCINFPNLPICQNITSYNFTANIVLTKGAQTITTVGTDSLGATTTVLVNGVADYCHIQQEDVGVQAERGTNQSNRCHEIDGCSVYLFEGGLSAKLQLRNNPMPNALFNQAPTDFGSGEVPPQEFFVHGLSPARPLPCNYHDVCYQTAGLTQARCDGDMYSRMKAVCRRAYPSTCPYSGLEIVNCPLYYAEREQCYATAAAYYGGLTAAAKSTFEERQDMYSTIR